MKSVLFLCVHNAGRSQMALGWFEHLARGRAQAWSGGSEPADRINAVAIEAMAEVGIDIRAGHPKRWTDEMLHRADVVVTMGCGDSCPFYPGTRYEDWPIDDPAGRGLDAVRIIRDQIGERVRELLAALGAGDPSEVTNMPGASPETRHVKAMNANWKPNGALAEGRFELMIVTDDDAQHMIESNAAAITAVVAMSQAETALYWDPTNETLIVGNIVGQWLPRG
jgi:arsenate reductase (thioredoxin)